MIIWLCFCVSAVPLLYHYLVERISWFLHLGLVLSTRDLLKHTISVTVSPGDVKSGVNLTMPNIRKKTMDYSYEGETDSLPFSALWH
jgi:hypothetical protein